MLKVRIVVTLFSLHVMSYSFETPWTIVHQVPLSMGFPRQEYWSGLPVPSPGDLPDPGIDPRSPALQVDSLPLRRQESPVAHGDVVNRRGDGEPLKCWGCFLLNLVVVI